MVRRVPGAIPRHQLPAGRVSDPGAGPGGRRGPGATTGRLIRTMRITAIGADKVVMRGRAAAMRRQRPMATLQPMNRYSAAVEAVEAPAEPAEEGTGTISTSAAVAEAAVAPGIRAAERYCFRPFVPVEFPEVSMPMDWPPGGETGARRPNRRPATLRDWAVQEEAVRLPVLQRVPRVERVLWLMV